MTAVEDPNDWAWLQAELIAAGGRFAESLRRCDAAGAKPTDPVPDLDWSLGRLGAHVVSIPRIHIEAQTQRLAFPQLATDAVNAFSDERARLVGTTDLVELADLLEADMAALLETLGPDGDRTVKFYEHDHSVIGVGGIALSEVLVHHHDLSTLTGESVPISRAQAIACLHGLFPMSTHFVDPAVARRCQGTVHIQLRGGDDWAVHIQGDGAAVVRENPTGADFHNHADPVALLMVSLGRLNPVKPLLAGKLFGWGPKPWIGMRSRDLFIQL